MHKMHLLLHLIWRRQQIFVVVPQSRSLQLLFTLQATTLLLFPGNPREPSILETIILTSLCGLLLIRGPVIFGENLQETRCLLLKPDNVLTMTCLDLCRTAAKFEMTQKDLSLPLLITLTRLPHCSNCPLPLSEGMEIFPGRPLQHQLLQWAWNDMFQPHLQLHLPLLVGCGLPRVSQKFSCTLRPPSTQTNVPELAVPQLQPASRQSQSHERNVTQSVEVRQ